MGAQNFLQDKLIIFIPWSTLIQHQFRVVVHYLTLIQHIVKIFWLHENSSIYRTSSWNVEYVCPLQALGYIHILFVHETWIINASFIKSLSQCNEVHRRKSVIFEKPKILKFGRGWPKVAGVADDGCGIINLDNLTRFHKKIIFVWCF